MCAWKFYRTEKHKESRNAHFPQLMRVLPVHKLIKLRTHAREKGMHIRRKFRMRNTIEVREFNSARCPGEHKAKARRPKTEQTPERVARNNQMRKQREAARMVEEYFNEDDLVLTLTFRKECRPEDMEGAKSLFKKFYTYLKREYARRFYELFWMRNIEVGSRKGWHIHLIVNRIDGAEFLIKDFWRQFGGVYVQYLQDLRDQGKDIGEYISKAPITCDRVTESNWSHSRNIHKVPGEDKIISGHRMTDKPRVPKGWYLDKGSCSEGTNADGYPYRFYTIRRITKKRRDHKMKPAKIRRMQRAREGTGKRKEERCKRRSIRS